MASPDPMSIPILSLLMLSALTNSTFFSLEAEAIGVNWGTAASHPLPPPKVVELLKANKINKVKLFDANPLVLESLSGSNILVTVGIPNSMLRNLNSSLKAAESWVHDNLTRFVSEGNSRVQIEYIAAGDEPFLGIYHDQFYPFVVGAAVNIRTALVKANLADKVKVIVPCSYDIFQSESGLPSEAHFRPNVNKTMMELLTFLTKHQSPFFITMSPFQSYRENKNISLDFTLFRKNAPLKNDSRKVYKNTFELNYDTIITTLSKVGFPDLDVVIGQIGWPTDGAVNATPSHAEEFMKGLMDHVRTKSGRNPSRRDLPTEIYILSLLDEDQRNASLGSFERHWGVFTFDGQAKYEVDLGQGSRKLVNAQDVKYLSSKWCVVNDNRDLFNATALALDACSSADCSALASGGSCSNLSWPGNISYAFNSYYQQHDQIAESCAFGGLGLITTVDPSVDTCQFIVELSTTSLADRLRKQAIFDWIMSPMVTFLLYLLSTGWR